MHTYGLVGHTFIRMALIYLVSHNEYSTLYYALKEKCIFMCLRVGKRGEEKESMQKRDDFTPAI